MKTTLIALNGKLSALTDVEKEVIDIRGDLVTSEGKRGELQVHIVESAKTMRIDTSEHEAKHTRNIKDIENLNADIQSLKTEMNERENEHLQAVEKLNQEHFTELANKDVQMKANENKYNDALTAKEKKHLDAVKQMQGEHADELNQRDAQHQSELRQLDQEKTRRENEYI